MKRDWKRRYYLAAVGVIAIGAKELMWEGPRARADEPVDWCGTEKVDNQQAVAQGTCPTKGACDTPSVRDSWIPGPSTPIVTIRIRFHIFCETDWTNCASSPSEVAGQMTTLNSEYAPYRIQFAESSESEYINNSTYRDLTGYEIFDMMNTFGHPGELNVYVTDTSAVDFIGVGPFPWNQELLGPFGGVIIDDGFFGTGHEVLTHECGHNLGLWHTHHGVSEVNACSACYERADGVGADVTGDFSSDTPPTPTSYDCFDATGNDACSVPVTPWAPTQPENYMSYAQDACWTLFTPQQAGRMHCWTHHALRDWIACTTNGECDDFNECTADLCLENVCQNPIATEVINSTCQDGLDNDCNGYADCDDGNCASDPACRCYDNGGNSPLVCVNWTAAVPPEPGTNFVVDFGTDPPGVTFRTGNGGWKVWAQVSRTNSAPANLGDIKIDPTSATANFSLTVAHGASPGAANVASMALVKTDWTGTSNLSGGSIAGNLEGNLILQGTAGVSGAANFTIGGNVSADVNIPTVDTFEVRGAVSTGKRITLGGFAGNKRAVFNLDEGRDFAGELSLANGLPRGAELFMIGFLTDTAFVDFNGHDLAGEITFFGGSAEQSRISIGPLVAPTGRFQLSGSTFSGTATLASIESGRVIFIDGATMDGSINVLGDWEGSLQFFGNFGAGGLISIDGTLTDAGSLYFEPQLGGIAGSLLIGQDCNGSIGVNGTIDGALTVSGVLNGDICAANLVTASGTLPVNIQIRGGFGQNGTICGTRVCPELLTADLSGVDKSRFISFFVPAATGTGEYAIGVVLTSLHHPNPPYTGGDAANFSAFEGQTRWVGQPTQFLESYPSGPPFYASQLQCEPYYLDWSTVGLLHVTGSAIVPSSEYRVQLVPVAGAACASSLTVRTTRWGDVVAPFNPPATITQPDMLDVAAIVDKFKSVPGAPIKAWAMLAGVDASGLIDLTLDVGFNDICAVVDAFKGVPYPYSIATCP